MDPLISPFILFSCIAVGAIGVALSLPRGRPAGQILGGILAATAFGVVILTLTIIAGPERAPNLFFYIFGFIALAASLRVITHPRPVYAALFFILTILSTAGLFLLLSAEFMTFALIIIYAGAILITYLFVIMLATQTPTEEMAAAVNSYDSVAREPIAATVCGFALLGALTGMLAYGTPALPTGGEGYNPDSILERLPRKVERSLDRAGLLDEAALPVRLDPFLAARTAGDPQPASPPATSTFNPQTRVAVLVLDDADTFEARMNAAIAIREGDEAPDGVRPLSPDALALIPADFQATGPIAAPDGLSRIPVQFPDDLRGENIELVGFALLSEHPLAIELAGIVLLMAMIGAVILARKQAEAGEESVHTIGEDPSLLRRAGA